MAEATPEMIKAAERKFYGEVKSTMEDALNAALAAQQPVSVSVNGIPATHWHDEGAIARCSHCGRYTLDHDALGDSHRQPNCECGQKHGWCGSFKKPGPDAKWSGRSPTPPAVPVKPEPAICTYPRCQTASGCRGVCGKPSTGPVILATPPSDDALREDLVVAWNAFGATVATVDNLDVLPLQANGTLADQIKTMVEENERLKVENERLKAELDEAYAAHDAEYDFEISSPRKENL